MTTTIDLKRCAECRKKPRVDGLYVCQDCWDAMTEDAVEPLKWRV